MKRNSLRLLSLLGLLAVVLCLPNAAHAESWVLIASVDENGVAEQIFFYFPDSSAGASRSRVAATGTPDAEPIQMGTPDTDPILMGTPDADPIVLGSPDADPIVMGTPDTTPIVMGTPDGTPIVMGSSPSRRTAARRARDEG